MRRCIVFLCCFLALTACSPRSFSGERAVRTYSLSDTADSAAVRRWLDKAVQESMEQHVRTVFDFDAVTVRETLSAPDSTGAQYVTSTSTTHARGRSVSEAGTETSREEKISGGVDSTAVASTHGEALTGGMLAGRKVQEGSCLSGSVPTFPRSRRNRRTSLRHLRVCGFEGDAAQPRGNRMGGKSDHGRISARCDPFGGSASNLQCHVDRCKNDCYILYRGICRAEISRSSRCGNSFTGRSDSGVRREKNAGNIAKNYRNGGAW